MYSQFMMDGQKNIKLSNLYLRSGAENFYRYGDCRR